MKKPRKAICDSLRTSSCPKEAVFATQAIVEPPLVKGCATGGKSEMTLTPAADLLRFPRYVCEYEDGGTDVFACPDSMLEQGPKLAMLRLVADEWQADGFSNP